jgi:hypothetical protein
MVCRNICERLYSKIIVGKSPYQDIAEDEKFTFTRWRDSADVVE